VIVNEATARNSTARLGDPAHREKGDVDCQQRQRQAVLH
jgi:hypothetical protein